MRWDDLRVLLAIHRARTLSAAARYLGVDATTVSRRLRSLQNAAGTALFLRLPDATLKLNQAGVAILAHAERMEREADAIGQALGEEAQKVVGTVRITAVPIVINRLLLPSLPSLLDAHPDLTVELVPDARDLSLTRRDADLAIRLARPVSGGTLVKARRIGTLVYGVFAAQGIAEKDAERLGWIAYDDTMAHLPQSKWLADLVASGTGGKSGIRVTDGETAVEAAASGLGKALVPTWAGTHDPRLRTLDVSEMPALPEREVWLLSHAEQRGFQSIRTVISWIETLKWSNRPQGV